MTIAEFFNSASSVLTVASFLTFTGIVLWAYSGRRAVAFAEAAHLPFADEHVDAQPVSEPAHCNSGAEVWHG